ncbi:MAG TPA: TIGR01777 family protein [bacterium]|nr:TIGR01777 family protein [bacterium]
MANRIILAGGSGFIGRALADRLVSRGDEVIVLSRNPQQSQTKLSSDVKIIGWDGNSVQEWVDAIDGAQAVVNLVGENLASLRWTKNKKSKIVQSRIRAGQVLVAALQRTTTKPALFVQTSGIGYYGSPGDKLLDEWSPIGAGFMPGVALQWEKSIAPVVEMGLRTIIIRSGLVLAKDSGFLKMVSLPFRFFVGGHLGSGKQWLSWIHLEDEIAAIVHLMDNQQASGIFNLCSPNPVQAKEFFRELGKAIHRSSWFHVPGLFLRVMLGEIADEIILVSQRATPKKLLQTGFDFKYASLTAAFQNIYSSDA